MEQRLGVVASLSSRGFCPQVGYPVLTVSPAEVRELEVERALDAQMCYQLL